MKNPIRTLFILLFLTCFSAISQTNDTISEAAKIILDLDLDGDGVIIKFEAKADIKDNFDLIDKNDDTYIREEELQLYLDIKNKS